ncbi:hypothetical protein LCGC14_1436060 [marine sediment metagenome]|uniref:FCP1 homology domain-containing protein n=1 Tax=marine sediment metagenome TaxID=412755 RepID=A0A0F9K8C0_9ZZZZ
MKIICIDFDGVLHSYKSGWKGAEHIPDPPVNGAIVWLRSMILYPDFQVCIYSSRSRQDGGIKAMRHWLLAYGMSSPEIEQIEFPTQKPAAFITIDDRAICFTGKFPDVLEVRDFKSWYEVECDIET